MRFIVVVVGDGTNALAGLLAEDPVPFAKKDWREMANTWAFAEEDPVVVDAEVDVELGIDGEGLGDACLGGLGLGDEDDKVEAVVMVTLDVENVGRREKITIGAAELLDAEECINQFHILIRHTSYRLSLWYT